MATNIRHTGARAKRLAKLFYREDKGGVAIIFGIAFPAVAFLSLVGVDYSRASVARQQLQETLDAAALLVARSSAVEADDVDEVGDKAFTAQLGSTASLKGFVPDEAGRLTDVTFTPEGTKITGTATADIDPIVANLFLKDGLTVTASSEVQRTVNKLEIALVLDTTGSMENSDKIGKLKTAADAFITQMELAAAKSTITDPIRISIVPFSTTVKVSDPVQLHKVGNSVQYNDTTHSMTGLPAWLDGQSLAWNDTNYTDYVKRGLFDNTTRDRFTLYKQMKVKWEGCVEARRPPYDIRETAPVSNPTTVEHQKTRFTPYFWPDDPDSKSKSNNKNGNFGTFKNDYLTDKVFSTTDWKVPQRDVTKYNLASGVSIKSGTFSLGTGYGANLTYGPNAGCAMKKMERLSTNFTNLKAVVQGLVASGETNIPLGLMWGWHTLSPNAPLSDGISYSLALNAPIKTTKIIVLMTDGDNTMNPNDNDNDSWYHGYGYQWQERLGSKGQNLATRTGYMNSRMVPPNNAPAGTESLCGNIKKPINEGEPDKIQIYAVGVGVSETNKTMLKKCATTYDYYYDVDAQGSTLASTFSAIAGRIENLRITK